MKISISKLMSNFSLALMVGVIAAVIGGFNPLAVAAPLAALGMAPGLLESGVLAMALQTEVWVADIEEQLYNDAAFVRFSVDHSEFVVNKTVHVPQGGVIPGVTVNRAVFPATITERTDTDLTYNVDSYSTDPIRVRDFEDMQLSYSKRNSVLGQHVEVLDQRIGDQVAYNWSTETAARHVITSGAVSAFGPDGTQNRRLLTKNDIAKAKKILDNDRVPKEGRYLLLTNEMYTNLLEGEAELLRKDFMNRANVPDGAIDRIFGFWILTRETVVNYAGVVAGSARKAIGAAAGAGDAFGAIAWHTSAVARAKGSIKVFYNENVAEHYGDIMSAEVGLGSNRLRTDEVGVVNIIQGA
jgi:hypothetical protein